MSFDIIVAVDARQGIGYQGRVPWKCDDDMRFFRQQTTKCPEGKINAVIMGRKTHESIGRELPNRLNIVLSREGKSLEEALGECNANPSIHRIYVIGGEEIYRQALKLRYMRVYATMVNGLHLHDTTFPFYEMSKECSLVRKRHGHGCVFYKFWRRESGEWPYINLLTKLLKCPPRETRNGVTQATFGESLRFDLSSFPLLTTKRVPLRLVFEELMFFLRGEVNTKKLEEKGVNIWKGNTSKEFLSNVGLPYEEGEMGPMYGFQLRKYGARYPDGDGYDQLQYVLHLLKNDPFSRRILMTTYNPAQASEGVLYPCHGISINFFCEEVDGKTKLSCHMTQRSADVFLGLPFNIASYSLLVYLLCASLTEEGDVFVPGELLVSITDAHLYGVHIDAAMEQISRDSRTFPILRIKEKKEITEYEFSDLQLFGYHPHPTIKAEMVA